MLIIPRRNCFKNPSVYIKCTGKISSYFKKILISDFISIFNKKIEYFII